MWKFQVTFQTRKRSFIHAFSICMAVPLKDLPENTLSKIDGNSILDYCILKTSYFPTLPFWTGGSRFKRTAPVLPFPAEISRSEMILAKIPDFYKNLGGTKLCYYLHQKQQIFFSNSMKCFGTSKRSARNEFENQCNL